MKKIEALRRERGWSKAELARRAGMDPSDVGRIESGFMVAYDSQTKKLAKALGVRRGYAHKLYDNIEETER